MRILGVKSIGVIATGLVLCLGAASGVWSQASLASALVVRGATVIDPRTGSLARDSVIVIQGDRIAAVGPASRVAVPAGATMVDAAGRFALPGLWDTHAHTRDFDGVLYINHGVTSTMDMGNILDWIHVLAEARAKQMAFGPRIFPQGMSISGTHGPHQWNARTPEDARWGARQNIEAGAAFLKVYQHATPEIIRAVSEEAQKAGLNLAAHLVATSARDAILNGVTLLAHGSGVAASTIRDPEIVERIKKREMREQFGGPAATSNALQDPAMFDDLVKLMVERNVRYEPNLVQLWRVIYDEWDQYQLENHRLSMHPKLRIPEMFVRMWSQDFAFEPYPPTPELRANLRKGYEMHQLFTRKVAAAGGKLMVGSDAYYHMVPGLSVWQEMELMAVAGVPAVEILQAATIHPAEFVHKEKDLGTIEAGKLADLILLRANPLEDIKNIRTLETVIQHGKVQELGYHGDYRNPIPRPYQRVNSERPQPWISSVLPSAVPIGAKGLVLTIKGRDFHPENRVLWEGTELRVLEASPTQLKVRVPDDLLAAPGTRKVHMVTGGRVAAPSLNFAEVMVTFGKAFAQRWNGQKLSPEFER